MPGDQPIAWPKAEEASHAVREYLAALDTARGDEDRGGDDGSSEGGQRRKPPKEVSFTDPQATWVARPGLDPFFAYDANYLIDNKAGIIIDAVGTRANRDNLPRLTLNNFFGDFSEPSGVPPTNIVQNTRLQSAAGS